MIAFPAVLVAALIGRCLVTKLMAPELTGADRNTGSAQHR